jgi:site-specific recombinase XerD
MELTLQRRHSPSCPDRKKGLTFLKCHGRCKFWIAGYDDQHRRIRKSLGTRDLARAFKLLAAMQNTPTVAEAPQKKISDAVATFDQHKADKAPETTRKYKRVLGVLREYCERHNLVFLPEITLEALDPYVIERRKPTATWLKEIEILREFFRFCERRRWIDDNPALNIERPRLPERDNIVPYTPAEVAKIIVACDEIGRTSYERLRAQAMILLMRFAGLRISDVVTLSREHIQGDYIKKRAHKNGKKLQILIQPVVRLALDALPHPKAAPKDSKLYFASGTASVRSLVKGAERTLAAVFKRSGVQGAFAHRFRHTFASELLGKGESIEVVAAILGDTPAIIRRHYEKWTPEFQSRKDHATRKIHGTNLTQAEETAITC